MITITWGTKVINVPRADLTLVQTLPIEIREMDLNWFHLQLKDLEDSVEGMVFPDTHIHNTEVSLGGLTYARVIEIINGYTVTFEDGQYAVNLFGANSNVGDVVNVNQVSVRSANSAGLISSPEIQFSSFNGFVTIDVDDGVAGTLFPTGTEQRPVNNLDDAILIAQYRGIKKLRFLSDFTFANTVYINNYSLYGVGMQKNTFYFESGCVLAYCQLFEVKCTGTETGIIGFKDCYVTDLGSVSPVPVTIDIIAQDCLIDGTVSLPPTYSGTLKVLDCWSNIAGTDTPTLDIGFSTANILVRNYSGGIEFKNASTDINVSVDLVSGNVILADTITAGTFVVRGVGNITNNSTNTFVQTTGLMSKFTIAEAVHDEIGTDIEYSSFGGGVTIDTVSGYTGTTYPTGTIRQKVNNIDDALLIANGRGFGKLFLDSSIVFDSDALLDGFIVIGASHVSIEVEIEPAASVVLTTFIDVSVSGTLDGGNTLIDCVVRNINYLNGHIHNSSLNGTIVLGGGSDAYLANCSILDVNVIPVIDMGVTGQDLAIVNYSGAIRIENLDSVVSRVGIAMNAGSIILDSTTVVAGIVNVIGIGTLVDENGTPITTGIWNDNVIVVNNLISKENIAIAVWDEPISKHLIAGSTGKSVGVSEFNGYISIDSNSSTTGTTFPAGTETAPINNIPDALLIAQFNGIDTLHFEEDFIITSGLDISQYTLTAHNPKTLITIESGVTTTKTIIGNCVITGYLDGSVTITNGSIREMRGLNGFVFDSLIEGDIYLGGSASTTFINCWRGNKIPISIPPFIDLGGSGQQLAIRSYTGGIELRNYNDPTGKISIDLLSGKVDLHETITGDGGIIIRGVGELNNYSTNTNINSTALVNSTTVSTAVWDEPISAHLIDGSTGKSVGVAQFEGAIHVSTGGVSGTTFPIGTESNPVNNIPDAVLIANTYGISVLHFETDFTFDSSINILGYELLGNGMLSTIFTFESGCILGYCRVREATVTGNMTGIIQYSNTLVKDFGSVGLAPSSINILMENCAFEGTISLPANYSGNMRALDCWASSTAQIPPVLDFGDSTAGGILHNYSGGIKFVNVTQNNKLSILISQGQVLVDSSVTSAEIVVKGVGDVIDNSGVGANVNTDGLMSKTTISTAVWDEALSTHTSIGTTGRALSLLEFGGMVHLASDGVSGTTFPIGTHSNPVNNINDAKLIGEFNDLTTLSIHGIFTVLSGEDISNYNVTAEETTATLIMESGCTTNNVQFSNLTITGVMSGFTVMNNCHFYDLYNFEAFAVNCIMDGNVYLVKKDGGTTISFFNLKTGTVGNSPVLDCGGDGPNIGIRGFHGTITFANKTGDAVVFIDNDAGGIGITDTVTAGIFTLKGVGYLGYNNAIGTTVVNNKLVNNDNITDAVWDKQLP